MQENTQLQREKATEVTSLKDQLNNALEQKQKQML